MDPRQFDNLIRRVARRGDRRSLLRVLVTAPLAAFGDPRRASAQAECPDGACAPACENHRDCRSKHDDPCVSNQCLEGLCVSAIIDCLPGHECCKGECCPSGCETDDDCAILDPCLMGRCGTEGQCEFTELDPCITCLTDEECLGNGENTICCDGGCRRPCPEGTLMGKGCECGAAGAPSLDGVVVSDDASGQDDTTGRADQGSDGS
jgi:hypothetical protein